MDTISHWFRPYELLTEEEEKAGKHPEFRYLANAIEVWGLQALLFVVLAFVTPHFWHSQMAGGVLPLIATTAAIGILFVAPTEWFFHRFMMHHLLAFGSLSWLTVRPENGKTGLHRWFQHLRNSITIKITYYVAKMAFGHGAHHKLTDVTPLDPERAAEFFDAVSKYEITTNDRTDHAVFPHFSVIGFWVFLFPVMAILQGIANALTSIHALHIPHLPIVLGFALALTWQVWLYENSHAIMHKSYREWWKPRIQLPIVGRWFSKVYRFHFFHHMNENCSLGVVGAVWFWYGWDRLFGTYKLAREELIENASLIRPDILEMSQEEIWLIPGATAEDFAAPPNQRRWVLHLDERSAQARVIWNQLFVESLKEVRRRRAASAAPA
jgi:hypothetical protein